MANLEGLLHSIFGFTGFRVNQEAVCRAATEGRDVLLVMPTGAGKSLCYQLPAIARGGTALVISPLIALMDDQANKLTAAGLKVARIHSGLSREDSRQACRDYLDGRLQFLFIAPERLRVPGFPEMLARRKPALVAIDEAHCISAWGHDFRPDYRLLGEYLPALRPAPIVALTATATPTVQRDIVTQLQLRDPALFIHGFRRDNLAIDVVEMSKPRRGEFTAKFLADAARRPAIVYAPSRRVAEELAGDLGRRFPAAAYHAGLAPEVRARVQRQFQAGKLEVVVATIAFGMGIDKADVRSVVHFALPASVEAYYQEIGRAGRDGQPARTVLLYSFVDRRIHETFLERDYPAAAELERVAKVLTDEFQMPEAIAGRLKMNRDLVGKALEKLVSQGAAQFDFAGNVRGIGGVAWKAAYQQQVEFRRAQIDSMMAFAETQQCRMTALIRHFGDTADAQRTCGHCDFCAPSGESAQPFAEATGVQERHMRTILRALDGQSKSTGKLHTELALMADRNAFDALLDGLARAGLISLIQDSFTNPDGRLIHYKKAALTHEGRTLGENEPLGVVLREEAGSSPGKSSKRSAKKAVAADVALTAEQSALEAKLRAWRKHEAAKTGKPAFIVFGDAALKALAVACPRTLSELLTVAGFGPDKVERYGAEICAICRGEMETSVPTHRDETAMNGAPRKRESKVAASTPRDDTAMNGAPRKRESKIAASTPRVEAAMHGAPRKERVVPERYSVGPVAEESVQSFRRERTVAADPSASLDADQQELEARLRAWRKAESERMGLPQFFVLGTSTLRSIVLNRPRDLAQLKGIDGIDPEKLDRFGDSILSVCNG